MPKSRRQYPGAAVSTTITSAIDSDDTSINIAATTGWPSGSTPFYVVVSPSLAAEEKMLVTRTASTLTVVAGGRGADGTVASSHSSGATVYPVITAVDLDEANEMAAVLTTKGDILVHGASSFARLAAGSNNLPLVADSAQTNGLKYAQLTAPGLGVASVTEEKLDTGAVTETKLGASAVTAAKIATSVAGDGLVGGAGTALGVNVDDSTLAISSDQVIIKDLGVTTGKLADDAVTAAKIAANAVGTSEIADDAVTAAKIATGVVGTTELADGAVTLAKTDSSLQAAFLPAGMVSPFAGASAPTGWLLCDGADVSRTTYAALFAVVGTTYGAGDGSTTFALPNMKGRVPVGLDATQAEFDVRGETGGAKTHTLVTAEMPLHAHSGAAHTHDMGAHTHAIDHNHASVTTTSDSHSHTLDVESTSDQSHSHLSTSADTVSGTPVGGGTTVAVANIVNSDSHTHSVDLPNFTGNSSTPSTNTTGAASYSGNTGNTGSGLAHNNLQPYITLQYIIKT